MARILLVDDSNTIRKTGDLLLKRMGHQVVTAEDGMDAFCKLSDGSANPGIAFVDITMPRINGHVFCELVSKNKRFSHIHLVVLSSHDGVTAKAKSTLTGAFMHVNKPFTAEDLEWAITACFGRTKLRKHG